MATKILLPRLGESVEEAEIGRWCKAVGDRVKRGDVIAELETAKSMMELECPVNGVLLATFVEVGVTIHKGELVAIVGKEGEDWQAELEVKKEKKQNAALSHSKQTHVPSQEKADNADRLRISPNAKRVAGEMGIEISTIPPRADGKRITSEDVAKLEKKTEPATKGGIPFIEIPLNQVEKTTAKRMADSFQTIPQFSISMEVNINKALKKVEKHAKESGKKITLTALLVKAAAEALTQHPRVNARFAGDFVESYQEANIALAVATERGLYVPVIHQPDKLALADIADRISYLAKQCKKGALTLQDSQGGTFTISNLGMKGVRQFVPIIDPNQAAILGIGEVFEELTLKKSGRLKMRKKLILTLTCDHRVIDGAGAADFLGLLKQIIEQKS